MSDPETAPVDPGSEPPAAPEPTPTGPALTVWHWYNTRIAGQVPTTATLAAADAHLRESLPALIADLERKA